MHRTLARSLLVASFLVACGGPGINQSTTKTMKEGETVDELLTLARQARWTFPTSSGRPVPPSAPSWAVRMVDERNALTDAARQLVGRGEHALAMELAARTWRAWILSRDDAGGRKFLSVVLEHGANAPSKHRALALYGDALFAFRLNDLPASRARSAAALEVAKAVGDREAEGLALLGLSRVDLSEGRNHDARDHAATSRALLRELAAEYGQAPLHMLAQATRLVGTVEDASKLFEESLELNRRLGDRGMVLVELHNLGHVELARGNVDKAERCFTESAALATDNDSYDRAMQLFNRAAVAFARGDRPQAKTLLGEMHDVLARANLTLATDDARDLDALERQVGR